MRDEATVRFMDRVMDRIRAGFGVKIRILHLILMRLGLILEST